MATIVVVLAGLTPWLFELGRMAIEATTQPLLVVLLLLCARADACASSAIDVVHGVAAGALLGLVTYSYTGSRLLGPLFAVALVRLRRSGALAIRQRRLGDLWLSRSSRSASTRCVIPATSPLGTRQRRSRGTACRRRVVVVQAIGNWFEDINPWHWATAGDPAPYIHNGGYGALLQARPSLLALAGVVLVVVRERDSLWWRYVLLATLLVPIPAALTVDRYNAIRLATLPVFVLVLAMPALAALISAARTSWPARAVAAALALTVAVQYVQFLDIYRSRGPARLVLFDAGVEPLLAQPLSSGEPIYLDFDDRGAQAQARWRAAAAGDSTRSNRDPAGRRRPANQGRSSSSASRTATSFARRSLAGRSIGSPVQWSPGRPVSSEVTTRRDSIAPKLGDCSSGLAARYSRWPRSSCGLARLIRQASSVTKRRSRTTRTPSRPGGATSTAHCLPLTSVVPRSRARSSCTASPACSYWLTGA